MPQLVIHRGGGFYAVLAGFRVMVDGVHRGSLRVNSRVAVEVPPGLHRVWLEMSGTRSTVLEVDVGDDDLAFDAVNMYRGLRILRLYPVALASLFSLQNRFLELRLRPRAGQKPAVVLPCYHDVVCPECGSPITLRVSVIHMNVDRFHCPACQSEYRLGGLWHRLVAWALPVMFFAYIVGSSVAVITLGLPWLAFCVLCGGIVVWCVQICTYRHHAERNDFRLVKRGGHGHVEESNYSPPPDD